MFRYLCRFRRLQVILSVRLAFLHDFLLSLGLFGFWFTICALKSSVSESVIDWCNSEHTRASSLATCFSASLYSLASSVPGFRPKISSTLDRMIRGVNTLNTSARDQPWHRCERECGMPEFPCPPALSDNVPSRLLEFWQGWDGHRPLRADASVTCYLASVQSTIVSSVNGANHTRSLSIRIGKPRFTRRESDQAC